MKGKKSDSQFVSSFIQECISNNKTTSTEILNRANSLIKKTEEEIKNIDNLKRFRSQLLDVVDAFKDNQKPSFVQEVKILPLFKTTNKEICHYICSTIFYNHKMLEPSKYLEHSLEDIIFNVKQLVKHRVISKTGNFLNKGECFDLYIKYVLGVQYG